MSVSKFSIIILHVILYFCFTVLDQNIRPSMRCLDMGTLLILRFLSSPSHHNALEHTPVRPSSLISTPTDVFPSSNIQEVIFGAHNTGGSGPRNSSVRISTFEMRVTEMTVSSGCAFRWHCGVAVKVRLCVPEIL